MIVTQMTKVNLAETYEWQFKGCDPTIALTISADFFLTLPAIKRRIMMKEFNTLLFRESKKIKNGDRDYVAEVITKLV
jgi:hypothetical protein